MLDLTRKRAKAIYEDQAELIQSRFSAAAAAIAPRAYAQSWGELSRPDKYQSVAPTFRAYYLQLVKLSSEAAFAYNKFALLFHVSNFEPDRSVLKLPPSVIELYVRELDRLIGHADEVEESFFQLENDAFLKELGIATHRLIPVGAGFCEPNSGIPRRALFQGGVRQFLQGLYDWMRCRGFRPFLAFHAHTLSLVDFSPDGWEQTYHRIAELIEANPAIRGWTGASWYLDPAMSDVSPHLCYLRDFPASYGCSFMFVGFDEEGTSGALSRSRTRRARFEDGSYVPAVYMRVWPRTALLRWSRTARRRAC